VKLLLYMPTHRDKSTREGHTFDPFQQAGFDSSRLEEVLEEKNIVLLYKGHFFDSANQGLQSASRIITVTDDDYDDIYTFIKDVDILLTDYSSIYFDFLLCRKPIILFPFDMDDYVAYSRPFYFDYSLMEGKRVFSWQELAEALGNDEYYVPSEQTIRLMNTYLDNNACRRVVEKVRQQISGN
jgi:CDP-glycerol glycerophosphotransferase